MNNNVLETTAELLEKLAEYFEAVEREKAEEVKLARERSLENLKSTLKETSGEDPEEEMVTKLSNADPEVLEIISAFIKKAHNNSIDEMGEPGAASNRGEGLSVDEAVRYTEQQLLEFCS